MGNSSCTGGNREYQELLKEQSVNAAKVSSDSIGHMHIVSEHSEFVELNPNFIKASATPDNVTRVEAETLEDCLMAKQEPIIVGRVSTPAVSCGDADGYTSNCQADLFELDNEDVSNLSHTEGMMSNGLFRTHGEALSGRVYSGIGANVNKLGIDL